MNNEFVERQLREVYRLTVDEPAELHKIQFESVGLFWYILIQHAKQVGARIGNKVLPIRSPRDLCGSPPSRTTWPPRWSAPRPS